MRWLPDFVVRLFVSFVSLLSFQLAWCTRWGECGSAIPGANESDNSRQPSSHLLVQLTIMFTDLVAIANGHIVLAIRAQYSSY